MLQPTHDAKYQECEDTTSEEDENQEYDDTEEGASQGTPTSAHGSHSPQYTGVFD